MSEGYFHDDGTLMDYSDTAFSGETVEGLKEDIDLIRAACDQPILKAGDFIGNRLRSGDLRFVKEFRRQSRLAASIVDAEEDAFMEEALKAPGGSLP